MNLNLSHHAEVRMKERGVDAGLLKRILDHADIERPTVGNCRLYRVTKQMSQALGDERMSRFAVIWSDDTGKIVTVVRHEEGHAGAMYRRRSFPKAFRQQRRRVSRRSGWLSSIAGRRSWS
jgi:hypothetical protein